MAQNIKEFNDPLQNLVHPSTLCFLDTTLENAYRIHMKNELIAKRWTTRVVMLILAITQSVCFASFLWEIETIHILILGFMTPKQLIICTIYTLALMITLFISFTFTMWYFEDPVGSMMVYSCGNGLTIFGFSVLLQLAHGTQEAKNSLQVCTVFCWALHHMYSTSFFGVPKYYTKITLSCFLFGQLVVLFVPDNTLLYMLHMANRRIAFFNFALIGGTAWETINRTEYLIKHNILNEEHQLHKEKKYTKALLKALLPTNIAKKVIQLKRSHKQGVIAQDVLMAGVMFVRIVGFEDMECNPDHELSCLAQILSLFDHYSETHRNLLKIKTIENSVMYATGVEGHLDVNDMVNWGLEMFALTRTFNDLCGHKFRLKIGIAVGPLVAGVIGSKCSNYDIWGDTVNTASRMETNGIEGVIHLTSTAKQMLESEQFNIELRGEIPIKGKGLMKTFLIKEIQGIRVNPIEINEALEFSKKLASFSEFFRDYHSVNTECAERCKNKHTYEPPMDITLTRFQDPKLDQDFDAFYHARTRKAIIKSRISQLTHLAGFVPVLKYGFQVQNCGLLGVMTSWSMLLICLLCAISPYYDTHWDIVLFWCRMISQLAWCFLTASGWLHPLPITEVILTTAAHMVTYHFYQRFWPALLETVIGVICYALILFHLQEALVPGLYIVCSLMALSICLHYNSEVHLLRCFYFNGILERRIQAITEEKLTSERLLLTILPKVVIEKLKENKTLFLHLSPPGGQATVLVADIVGFTSLCSSRSAKTIVQILDHIFTEFENLCALHQVTKVKTIGDAIIVASNLEEQQEGHAERMVNLALDMIGVVEIFNQLNQFGVNIAIRVGINTGDVIAGAIRTKSFSFDVWGKGMRLADYLETVSEPQQITISESTYQLVKDLFYIQKGKDVTFKGQFMSSYKVLKRKS